MSRSPSPALRERVASAARRVKPKSSPNVVRAARWLSLLLLASVPATPGSAAPAADAVTELLREVHWGETSQSLLRQFDGAATQLPRSLDFGDSYVDVVLRGETIGGIPVVTFFQMDKRTRGLKRIQLERQRHGVNPPALRAISAARALSGMACTAGALSDNSIISMPWRSISAMRRSWMSMTRCLTSCQTRSGK